MSKNFPTVMGVVLTLVAAANLTFWHDWIAFWVMFVLGQVWFLQARREKVREVQTYR